MLRRSSEEEQQRILRENEEAKNMLLFQQEQEKESTQRELQQVIASRRRRKTFLSKVVADRFSAQQLPQVETMLAEYKEEAMEEGPLDQEEESEIQAAVDALAGSKAKAETLRFSAATKSPRKKLKPVPKENANATGTSMGSPTFASDQSTKSGISSRPKSANRRQNKQSPASSPACSVASSSPAKTAATAERAAIFALPGVVVEEVSRP